MKLSYKFRELKLRYPFTISRHTYYSQPSICVDLSYAGNAGFGESTTNPYYKISERSLAEAFDKVKSVLENHTFEHPDMLWDVLQQHLGDNYFALNAINNASWDLYGKLKEKPVWSLVNASEKGKPLTSYTIGIDKTDIMLRKMQELPWPVYKIKVGTDHDIKILETLRHNTNAIIRIDANGAWSAEETRSYSKVLSDLNIEFVEQPLPAYDKSGMGMLFDYMPMPLIADESCVREKDVAECHGLFHGINIKLQKCGGITPALRMIREARALGLKIMLGCMTESTIGISAAVQLMSLVDYADLDGPLLIAEDPAEGLEYTDGQIVNSVLPGLGFNLKK